MPQFERYIGVDYSGAETPTSSLPGLRVYVADGNSPPQEVLPPPEPRKYWTRRGVAEFLRVELLGPKPVLVGIDHAFSFPLPYFEKYHLPQDWHSFLDDFQRHWPTDEDHTYVCFVTDDPRGEGRKRMGDPSWLRLTETWTPAAKSVFQFNVQGQVATSTHAGLPWLRHLRAQCGSKVHFWPFEGWEIPPHRSVVAEVYPSLWMRRFGFCAFVTWHCEEGYLECIRALRSVQESTTFRRTRGRSRISAGRVSGFGADQASETSRAGGLGYWCGLGNVVLVRPGAWLPKKVCAVFRLFNAAPRRFEVEIG